MRDEDIRMTPQTTTQTMVSFKNKSVNDKIDRVFPKLYKVGNVANKGLREEEQNNLCKKTASSGNGT